MKETEQDFLSWLLDIAKLYGWRIHHTRAAWSQKGWRTPIQGHAGFPDMVLAHPQKRRLIMAELKREDGKVSPVQQEWLDALALCPGVECYLWRPSDRDKIQKILQEA